MHPFLLLCTLSLYILSCSPMQVPLGLGLNTTAGPPTLTLPYATYRATNFNPNGKVISHRTCRGSAVVLTAYLDLHLQKHPLCRSPDWSSPLGTSSATTARIGDTGWLLWSNMQAGTHEGTATNRTWRKTTHRAGFAPIPCRHPSTKLRDCR